MKHIVFILLLVIGIKLMYVFSIGVFNTTCENKIPLHTTQDIMALFKKNDSWWYEKVATNGHKHITRTELGKCEEGNIQQSYYAFFPLYPAIVGITMLVTDCSFDFIAFVFSIIFSFLMFTMFYLFAKNYFVSANAALMGTFILILFPFHYYFSAYLSESLFLLLLILSFYLIDENKITMFTISAMLLVLVRPNGLFMLIPLYIYYLERYYSLTVLLKEVKLSALKNYVRNLFFISIKNVVRFSFFAIPVAVFIIYCIYLRYMTGDFFAYKTAQAGWCRETVLPWVPILRSKTGIDYFNATYLLFFSIISISWIKKIPLSFLFLIWISLLLPLTANTITSPRFISVIFIFPLYFGKLLNNKSTILQTVVLIILVALQLYTFVFWRAGGEETYLL